MSDSLPKEKVKGEGDMVVCVQRFTSWIERLRWRLGEEDKAAEHAGKYLRLLAGQRLRISEAQAYCTQKCDHLVHRLHDDQESRWVQYFP